MSLWDRIKRIGKSEANAAVDKMENAQKMADQIIREMKENLQSGINGQAEIKASALKHRSDERKARDEAAKWESKTEQLLARVEAGTLDAAEGNRLANEAAERYEDFVKSAESYAGMAKQNEDALSVIDKKISLLRDNIEEYEEKAKLLKSRAKTADVSEKINSTLSNVEVDGLISTFERMEEKVSTQEFKAQAFSEVSDATMSTEQEIDKVLGGGSGSALDKFKAKKAASTTATETSK